MAAVKTTAMSSRSNERTPRPKRALRRSRDLGGPRGEPLELPKRAARNTSDSEAESASFLSMYFRDMSALEVLRPEEEFTAAREIEALEIMLWERVLAYPPLVDHVLKVVATCMDNSLRQFRPLRRAATEARRSSSKAAQQKLARAAATCARELRAVDPDKQYIEAVLGELGWIEREGSGRVIPQRLTFKPTSGPFTDYLRLVRAAERAAAEARNDFVKANLRLVVSIARRFNHGRMALADLIQEGNLGLIKAVERYDYQRGFRFSTYASWWIRHAISRALADKGREVRLPVHMIDAHHKLSRATRELTTKLGNAPTSEELAEATQIPVDKIEKMRTYLMDASISLDRPVGGDEDGRTFGEYLQDPVTEETSPIDGLALQAMSAQVRRLLTELRPIEADILRQRFGLDDDEELTLKEIGAKYSLSRERIRQLQEQALEKMRRALELQDMM